MTSHVPSSDLLRSWKRKENTAVMAIYGRDVTVSVKETPIQAYHSVVTVRKRGNICKGI
jgi:hypothetical protein